MTIVISRGYKTTLPLSFQPVPNLKTHTASGIESLKPGRLLACLSS